MEPHIYKYWMEFVGEFESTSAIRVRGFIPNHKQAVIIANGLRQKGFVVNLENPEIPYPKFQSMLIAKKQNNEPTT